MCAAAVMDGAHGRDCRPRGVPARWFTMNDAGGDIEATARSTAITEPGGTQLSVGFFPATTKRSIQTVGRI
ncbi:Hypp927 [Branchiostoma lanceolatum]|uniref:Hypp927 protein n=1 Tax=Branchiostoma lanceolatum TaxID=7740 RepID=A0A8K0EGP9_BRALA|nr:Hypp927 [Branchiostoma lanceolatum]